MKYIVFSDLHAHEFTEFAKPDETYGNTRLANIIHAVKDIFRIARADDRTVLFAGDLFHARGSVRSEVFNYVFKVFQDNTDVPVIMIRGNHDASNNSLTSPSSIEPFSVFPNVHLVTTLEHFDYKGDTITAVSYGDEHAEIKKFIKDNPADILLAHLGIEGAKGAGYSKLEGAFTVGDMYPEHNKVVLMGHYHRSQTFTDNMLYVGNPVAQNFSDAGMPKGAYTFEIDNHALKDLEFVDLGYPMFETATVENYTKVKEDSYVRLTASKEDVKTMELTTDIPDNVRLDVAYEATDDTRINISTTDTPEDIARSWAKEFMPEQETLIINMLNKVQ